MEVNKKRYATIIVLYNPEVVGSSPASATRKEKSSQKGWLFSFIQLVRSYLNALKIRNILGDAQLDIVRDLEYNIFVF